MWVYIWTGTQQPQSWIYTKDWLISISSDWSNWITIADKNLWATTVYNYGDTLNSANWGCIYQWGNNYGFPYTWTITVVGTPIDASAYWPWNYYYSSAYRWNSSGGSSSAYWDTSENTNLWGDVTDTLTARQWPCPSGYHIATQTEWGNLQSVMTSLWITSQVGWKTYLKIPLTGYRQGTEWGTPSHIWTNAYWWSSTWRDGIQPSVKIL